jgi:hypothetical protein
MVKRCRYPADRIPLRTSSKSRRRIRRAFTHTHVSIPLGYATRHRQLGCRRTSRGTSSQALAQGSSVLSCLPWPQLLSPSSGAARVLPHVPWYQLPLPSLGQLRRRHVSYGSCSRLLIQGSSRAATCLMELYKMWAIEVNKYPPVALSS